MHNKKHGLVASLEMIHLPFSALVLSEHHKAKALAKISSTPNEKKSTVPKSMNSYFIINDTYNDNTLKYVYFMRERKLCILITFSFNFMACYLIQMNTFTRMLY